MALPINNTRTSWQTVRIYALNMKVALLSSKMVKGISKIEVILREGTFLLEDVSPLLATHAFVVQSSCSLIKYIKHILGLEKGYFHPHPSKTHHEQVKKIFSIFYHTCSVFKDSFAMIHKNYFFLWAYSTAGWGEDYSPVTQAFVDNLHEWTELLIPVKETVRIIALFTAVQTLRNTHPESKKLCERRWTVIKASLSTTSHTIRLGFWVGEIALKICPTLMLPAAMIPAIPYLVILPTLLSVSAAGIGIYSYYKYKIPVPKKTELH